MYIQYGLESPNFKPNTRGPQMVQKCGKDSMIPVIMAVDALVAGIDTTGNTGILATDSKYNF